MAKRGGCAVPGISVTARRALPTGHVLEIFEDGSVKGFPDGTTVVSALPALIIRKQLEVL
mgnify:CR=1 FL=1